MVVLIPVRKLTQSAKITTFQRLFSKFLEKEIIEMSCPEMIKSRLDVKCHSESECSLTGRIGNDHAKFCLRSGFCENLL